LPIIRASLWDRQVLEQARAARAAEQAAVSPPADKAG
jgi:hypothetical protein